MSLYIVQWEVPDIALKSITVYSPVDVCSRCILCTKGNSALLQACTFDICSQTLVISSPATHLLTTNQPNSQSKTKAQYAMKK